MNTAVNTSETVSEIDRATASNAAFIDAVQTVADGLGRGNLWLDVTLGLFNGRLFEAEQAEQIERWRLVGAAINVISG